MKYIDKFLAFLKTDRNTFVTYVLVLITAYILVDRIVEIMFMCFTGISLSYWGPIQYSLAIACTAFSFYFAYPSKLTNGNHHKIRLFNVYCIALYIVGLSLIVQYGNKLLWLLLLSVPNATEILEEFPDLIHRAFTAVSLYLPLVTFYPLFKWLYTDINDTRLKKESIMDYPGIDLSDTKVGTGPYTCENILCTDRLTGKKVILTEATRFEPVFICGPSASGKSSLVFEPMMARDLEKKFFFKEVSKEMGYTALKTGIATLNVPYDNDYLNQNFSLRMLTPKEGKEKIYYAYMHKLLLHQGATPKETTYRDIGFTYMAPDPESIYRMIDVAKNFNVSYRLIDVGNPAESVGLNPFALGAAGKAGPVISGVLKMLHQGNTVDLVEAYHEDAVLSAIENLSYLLLEMYPREHEGLLPNLDDIFLMLTDFDLAENMCNRLLEIPGLAEKYALQLGYFKRNFYKSGPGRKDTESHVHAAITQLDNLLRSAEVRQLLCNRTPNNLDIDHFIENGDVVFFCSRRSNLGVGGHIAIGLFFLFITQFSVLGRPGVEKSRIPHFLYVDEFPNFLCKATTQLFTFYRKYHVGIVITAQSLDQLGAFRPVVLTNSTTKMVFGGNTPEENEWWTKEFGVYREWLFSWPDYKFKEDGDREQDASLKGINWGWKDYFQLGNMQAFKFKDTGYKTKNNKGKFQIGPGKVDFLESKYKVKHDQKFYQFTKFSNHAVQPSHKTKEESTAPKMFSPLSSIGGAKGAFDDNKTVNMDPVKTDTTDASYFLNNDEAIVFDLNKKKKETT